MIISTIPKWRFVVLVMMAAAVNTPAQEFPAKLPAVALKEDRPQPYVFQCDYLFFDLAGKMTRKERVSGLYTRGLPEGKARWDDVRIASEANPEAAFSEGELQKYMSGFSYVPGDTNQFKDSFFAGFPNSMQTKTLVWDVSMFEQFAWKYFNSLKLNEPFETGASDVALPGGKFANRRPQLTWVGISTMNGKRCAIIQYEALFNLLSLQNQGHDMQGRSDYWGTIWVSLADKQIEKGTLNEGVLLGIPVPGQSGPQAVSIFRQATFYKKQ